VCTILFATPLRPSPPPPPTTSLSPSKKSALYSGYVSVIFSLVVVGIETSGLFPDEVERQKRKGYYITSGLTLLVWRGVVVLGVLKLCGAAWLHVMLWQLCDLYCT
jgi:hypothetical protein